MSARIVVVGDVVLDRDIEGVANRLAPDAPVPVVDVTRTVCSPGGAGLAVLLCRHMLSGGQVRLVAPVADDEAGHQLRAGLSGRGRQAPVDVVALGHEGPTRVKSRVRVSGQSLLRVDDGGPGRPIGIDSRVGDTLDAALADADVVLVADYGGGMTRHPVVRDRLTCAAASGAMVWDPHPKGGDPVPGVLLATPNEPEARGVLGDPTGEVSMLAEEVRAVWETQSLAVTVGARGAFVARGGSTTYVPARSIAGLADTCGAGDAFAAAAAAALGEGADVIEAVERATASAGRWIAEGGIATFRDRLAAGAPRDANEVIVPGWAPAPVSALEVQATVSASELAARLQGAGGTLVATGGCFDILHTGHLATLEAARSLGDGLVVLINSDDSIRRLKGLDRPAVGEQERARMLSALRCVDAVEIFEENTPVAALDRLRPQVWVKGGDYRVEDLPEARHIRSWGGRIVLVPYVAGRSTTELLTKVAHA